MSGPALGRSGGLPTDLPIGGFHFMPDISKGLGFSATHTAPGIRFTAFAKLTLDNPNFTFRLDITRGHLKTAEVELSGLAAVRVGFDGGTNAGLQESQSGLNCLLIYRSRSPASRCRSRRRSIRAFWSRRCSRRRMPH
jgi:hypothetical protein